MKILKIFLLIILFLLFFKPLPVWADNLCPQNACANIPDTADRIADKISCLSEATDKCAKQRVDLTSQINYMDTQIKLTTTKIYQTQNQILFLDREIATLSGQIDRLENSLGDLSKILLARIVETYKQGSIQPFHLLFSSSGFSDFLTKAKYIRIVQMHDKRLMFQMQETKDNYTDQKKVREEKKQEQERLKVYLNGQKIILGQQVKDKQTLLEVTKNNEQKFQELLNSARAEQQAIQQLTGWEATRVSDVKAGDTIGTILSGVSACSTGTHLHFEVHDNNAIVNPANYLKSIPFAYDYDTNAITDLLSASGSWDWPVDDPVIIEQIYGMSYWARVLNYYRGSPHTGIDMKSGNNLRVKAIRDGTLYKGAIPCGGGSLPFARVDQADNIQTYYLHIY